MISVSLSDMAISYLLFSTVLIRFLTYLTSFDFTTLNAKLRISRGSIPARSHTSTKSCAVTPTEVKNQFCADLRASSSSGGSFSA